MRDVLAKLGQVVVNNIANKPIEPLHVDQAPIKRCSSPVEVVLTGSRAVLPGLVEIIMGSRWGHGTINQG